MAVDMLLPQVEGNCTSSHLHGIQSDAQSSTQHTGEHMIWARYWGWGRAQFTAWCRGYLLSGRAFGGVATYMIRRVVQAGGRKVGGRCQWQVQDVPLGEGGGEVGLYASGYHTCAYTYLPCHNQILPPPTPYVLTHM